MIIKVLTDKFNPKKTWTIVKHKCCHYTLVQHVAGQRTGTSRMGIKRIRETLSWATI